MLRRTLLVALLVLAPRAAASEEPRRIPVIVHMPTQEGADVAPKEFVAAQIERANELFRQLDFELAVHAVVPLAERHAELVTRRDRDALARYVRRGAIHWFVVAKLMDVDEPGRERRGVHWHPRPAPGKHFVIVSKISGPYVLAHELAHFFGNPEHSPVPGNLLSYERGEGPPFLDDAQAARIRRALARMLASGELAALKPR